MDYFVNVLGTFLDIEHVRTLAISGGSESSPISSLIGVLKMNEGPRGLKQHDGEELMTEFSFLSELSL